MVPDVGQFYKLVPVDPDETSIESSRPTSSASPEPRFWVEKRRTKGNSFVVVEVSKKRVRDEKGALTPAATHTTTLGVARTDENGSGQHGTGGAEPIPPTVDPNRPHMQGEVGQVGGEDPHDREEEGCGVLVEATGGRGMDRAASWLRSKGMRLVHVGKAIENLEAIANMEAAEKWKRTLVEWRARVSLVHAVGVGGEVTDAEKVALVQRRDWLTGMKDWDGEFIALYDRVKKSEALKLVDIVRERMEMAQLSAKYLQLKDSTDATGGRLDRTVAKEEMYTWLYGKDLGCWNEFGRDLKYWKRWKIVTDALSAGTLTLWPKSINKSWITQTLNEHELELWLQAIHRYCAPVIALGAAATPFVLSALDGEPIPHGRLRLEIWNGTGAALRSLNLDWFSVELLIPNTPTASQRSDGDLSSEWGSDPFT
jgi:hypothetical protein